MDILKTLEEVMWVTLMTLFWCSRQRVVPRQLDCTFQTKSYRQQSIMMWVCGSHDEFHLQNSSPIGNLVDHRWSVDAAGQEKVEKSGLPAPAQLKGCNFRTIRTWVSRSMWWNRRIPHPTGRSQTRRPLLIILILLSPVLLTSNCSSHDELQTTPTHDDGWFSAVFYSEVVKLIIRISFNDHLLWAHPSKTGSNLPVTR